MGLSSIGVVTNSLLLRFRFSLQQQQAYRSSLQLQPPPQAVVDINNDPAEDVQKQN